MIEAADGIRKPFALCYKTFFKRTGFSKNDVLSWSCLVTWLGCGIVLSLHHDSVDEPLPCQAIHQNGQSLRYRRPVRVTNYLRRAPF